MKVIGDLRKSARLVSLGMEMNGGSNGVLQAEWSQLYDPADKPPGQGDIKLPAWMPGMKVLSMADAWDGPLLRRTYRLAINEGQQGDKGTVEYRPRGREQAVCTLSTTLEDVPLILHTNIKELMRKYGGVEQADGSVEFPRQKPKGSGGNGVGGKGLSGGTDEKDANPLWGMKTFKLASVVFSVRWVWKGSKSQPWPKWWKMTGTIDDSPEAVFGAPKLKNRDWLYLGITTRATGTLHEVEESWLLSPPGGWQEDVYGAKALNAGGNER